MKIRNMIPMSKKIRFLLCSVMGLVTILSTYQFVKLIQDEPTETQTYSVYDYSYTPELSYQVKIKENPVYEGAYQGEDLIYTRSLIQSILVDFKQSIIGTEEVEFEGAYQITAQVRGIQTKDGVANILWTKDYEILPKKMFKLQQDTWENEEQIAVTLDEYDEFAKKAIEITEITASTEVAITLSGQCTINGIKDPITIPINSTIIIPLNSNTFQIQKNAGDTITDSINETVEVAIEKDKKLIIIYILLSCLGIGTIIFLMIATRDLNKMELVKKRAKKLLNNYGSRMVAVNTLMMPEVKRGYKVERIEDLIKVSDDLQQPIIYELNDKKEVQEYKFYVINKETLFLYQIFEEEKE